ncbi:hypothetical protein HanPSC8_Chr10g0419301 [Helianthus annuus]|nr:hypothetical protein HanPSC8_Chr10g0419301 [Helianthus annuus]
MYANSFNLCQLVSCISVSFNGVVMSTNCNYNGLPILLVNSTTPVSIKMY